MKIGVYCRVSGDKQRDNTSLPQQKKFGVDFCERNGYEYEVFSEVVSGSKSFEDRKMFSLMQNKIVNGEINGIWILDLSRGWRNDEYKHIFLNILNQYNLKLFDRSGEVDWKSSEGKMIMGMMSVFNDFNRNELVWKMKMGKKIKWREGLGLSNVGFGWEKNKEGRFVVNKEESDVVKEIYRLYLRKDVKFYKDVEKRLITKYGKVVNGRRINGGLVERVLGKEKYKGIFRIEDEDGEKFEFDIGRIIEDDVFDEVMIKKNKNKSLRSVNMVENYILKGKVVCGNCWSNMWIKGGGKVDSKGNVYRYYFCNDKYRKERYDKKFSKDVIEFNRVKPNRKFDLKEYEKKNGKFKSCDSLKSNIISRNGLDDMVWKGLYVFLKDSDVLKDEYKKRYSKNEGEKDRVDNKLNYYDKELVKLEKKKLKIIDLYVDGEMSKEDKDLWMKMKYDLKKEEIKKKISGLEKEKMKYKNPNKIEGYIDLMKRDLDKEFGIDRFEDRRRLIEKYIDWVSVVYIKGKGDSKVYKINMRLLFGENGEFIEVDSGKIKKGNQINDYPVYKVKSEIVGAEGFEPPTPWV